MHFINAQTQCAGFDPQNTDPINDKLYISQGGKDVCL